MSLYSLSNFLRFSTCCSVHSIFRNIHSAGVTLLQCVTPSLFTRPDWLSVILLSCLIFPEFLCLSVLIFLPNCFVSSESIPSMDSRPFPSCRLISINYIVLRWENCKYLCWVHYCVLALGLTPQELLNCIRYSVFAPDLMAVMNSEQ